MVLLSYTTLDSFFANMPKHADLAWQPGGNTAWVLAGEMVGSFNGSTDPADPRFRGAVVSDLPVGFNA